MNVLMNKMYLAMKSLIEREEGQDLVEYALVVALIAFGAITGMGYLATGLNHAFSTMPPPSPPLSVGIMAGAAGYVFVRRFNIQVSNQNAKQRITVSHSGV